MHCSTPICAPSSAILLTISPSITLHRFPSYHFNFHHFPSYHFNFHHFLSLLTCLLLIHPPPPHIPFLPFPFFIPLFIRFIFFIQPDGLQGEADLEVDKIIAELTAGILSPASSAPTGKIVGQTTPAQVSCCMPL